MEQLHSAVRWGKPVAEIAPLVGEHINTNDPKNGNQALHIAVQNGHFEITKWLVSEKGAAINGQNGKGQTPLHMSVEYDYYEQTQWLLDQGADQSVKNGDGHAAITGIDGGKIGVEAYPGPMQLLMVATDKDTVERAYAAFEEFLASQDVGADADLKVKLAQAGMKRKKELKECWDSARWMKIVQSVP